VGRLPASNDPIARLSISITNEIKTRNKKI